MTLVTWSPFREFDDFFNRYSRLPRRELAAGESELDWRPVANISETEKEYLIKAELPEVSRDDIEVKVNEGVITIKGVRRMEKASDDEQHHRVESFYGAFSRSFSLPSDVDESGISAESRDGVLKVHLPKTAVVEPKAIDIAIG